jgi:hypothetical protein
MEDIDLRLLQHARTWNLGVADADTAENNRLGWVGWRFEVPAGAEPSPAKLLPEPRRSRSHPDPLTTSS